MTFKLELFLFPGRTEVLVATRTISMPAFPSGCLPHPSPCLRPFPTSLILIHPSGFSSGIPPPKRPLILQAGAIAPLAPSVHQSPGHSGCSLVTCLSTRLQTSPSLPITKVQIRATVFTLHICGFSGFTHLMSQGLDVMTEARNKA